MLNYFVMKELFGRFFQMGLKMVLGILGYSSISGCGGMYGTPTADFDMRGKVVNERGECLSEVKINSLSMYHDSVEHVKTLTFTDEEGTYRVMKDLYSLGWGNDGYPFRFVGDTTLYEPFDTIIPENQLHFKGAHGWYEGKTSITVNVTLKDKKKNVE